MAEAIVNYVALLGWSPSDNREIFSLEELVEAFDYHHMSESPAVFDIQKLRWMNGEYIKAMPEEKFYEIALPYMKEVLDGDYDYHKIAAMVQTRIDVFPDIRDHIDFFREVPEYDISMYKNKKWKTTEESCLGILNDLIPILTAQEDYANDPLYQTLTAYASEKGIKSGSVMWAVRTALSGKQTTPTGATGIMEIIGKDETISRLNAAIKKLSES